MPVIIVAMMLAIARFKVPPNVPIQPRVLSVGCNARLGLVPYGSSSESPKPA